MRTTVRRQGRGTLMVLVCLLGLGGMGEAATRRASRRPPVKPASNPVQALLLSDLHFDPLRDPAKYARLREAAVENWETILESPPSSTQATDFAALQKICRVRGEDADWPLLRGSLNAAHRQSPHAAFVTVGGDLLVHELDCRVRTLDRKASKDDLSNFSAKTLAYVALALRQAFPKTPVYLTLGNNDSGCGDYRESAGSQFLKSAAESFAAAVPPGERSGVVRIFPEYGDYSVALPGLAHTRLLALQDIFESSKYATCDGQGTQTPDGAQTTWLRQQLEQARAAHEHVWVLAHIPPGVDVYASFRKYVLAPSRVCEVKAPTMFLHSNAMAETMAEFPDVIKLALFAHTHMDEIKLLRAATGEGSGVPAKVTPSISPINGNRPAFLVAQVDQATGSLLDYTAFVAESNAGTSWAPTYSFRQTYGLKDFSGQSVSTLAAAFQGNSAGNSDTSKAYQQWFYAGDNGLYGLGLQQIWGAYSCSITETDAENFRKCLCPAKTAP